MFEGFWFQKVAFTFGLATLQYIIPMFGQVVLFLWVFSLGRKRE